MPYQNDLSTLADVVGPAYAAQQAGIQNDAANQQAQAEAAVAQNTIGAKSQQPTLANQLLGAQTYAEQGLGMQQQAKGLQDLYAAPSGAQAMVAGNQLKISQDQAEKLSTLGQMSGQLAGYMQQIPPAARPAAMQQFLQSQNVTDPGIVQAIGDGDPDKLNALSQHLFETSSQARQTILSEGIRGQTAENVAAQEVQGRQNVASTLAGSRVNVAGINAAVKQATAGLGALQQQLYAKVSNGTATPAERQALDSINQTQQLTRQGSPFQAAITGTAVAPNVPPVPNTSGQGNQPQQQPSQPVAVPDAPAAKQAAEQKWGAGSYDTSKYNYVMAVNPATGQMDLGRIPK